MTRGLFITLEGGEGAGKSTLLEGLRAHVQTPDRPPVVTREPGGTRLGEGIRALALEAKPGTVCAESELLLMFAARAQLVSEIVEPALAAGQTVLCDRFTDASYAYQGAGRGQPQARIEALENWAAGALRPDLTLLLDLPVTTGRERIAGRHDDRIESEGDAFFHRVRQCYRDRAAAEPGRFRIIDASAEASIVLDHARQAVDELLRERAS